VFDAENATQVRRFLRTNPDFKVIEPKSLLGKALPAMSAEAVLFSPEGLTLTPLRTRTDGFFLSVLEKVG
jgi:16S rRNA (cytosine967-C5)-methyltransferase